MYILYSMYKIMKFCIEIVGVFTYWWFVTSNNKYLLSFQPFYELFMQWGQKTIFNYDFCHPLLSPSKYLHEDDISHQGGEYVCIRLTLSLPYNFRQNFFKGILLKEERSRDHDIKRVTSQNYFKNKCNLI